MADKTITQLTAIDALATGDEVGVWDASASASKKASGTQLKAFATAVDIVGLSSATPVVADSLVIYDLDATANKKVTVDNIKTLATLVDIVGLSSATPVVADSLVIYDLDATANKKVTVDNIKTLSTLVDIHGLSSATPASNDEIVIYDTSATANKRATLSDVLALGGGGGGGAALQFQLSPFAASFPSSNYAELGVINERPRLAFDASTAESATWALQLPATVAATWTLYGAFIMASATSGSVVLAVQVEAVSAGDATDLDATTSFDTAVTSTISVPATAGYRAAISITVSNIDSAVALDYVRLKIYRDATSGSDTASGDAYLLPLTLAMT